MLTLENVSKMYKGGKKAVNSINLNIAKGEFICFIGPSGCGKTTTMKMAGSTSALQKLRKQLLHYSF